MYLSLLIQVLHTDGRNRPSRCESPCILHLRHSDGSDRHQLGGQSISVRCMVQYQACELENDNSENRKRFYESDDENDHHFTQFGDIFTFTLRANPETKEKCFDTLEYYHTFHVSFC